MSKKEFWRSLKLEQKHQIADSVGSSSEYLRQVFMYGRKTGPALARDLAAISGIGAHEFCPDAFSAGDVLHIQHEPKLIA